MKIKFIILFYTLIFCVISCPVKAEVNWDILGISIGSNYENSITDIQNKFSGTTVENKGGSLCFNNGYNSPELNLGARLVMDTSSNIGVGDIHVVELLRNQEKLDEVIGIKRYQQFIGEDKPLKDELVNSLLSKYGKPDLNVENVNGVYMFWLINNKHHSKNDAQAANFFNEYAKNFNFLLQPAAYQNVDYSSFPVETMLVYQIKQDRFQKNLVDSFVCTLESLSKINDSVLYTKKIIKDGSDKFDQEKLNSASKNKPIL